MMIYYLKPCPFCGKPAHLMTVEQPDGRDTYMVDCHNDGCEVSPFTRAYDKVEDAYKAWNWRVADADS